MTTPSTKVMEALRAAPDGLLTVEIMAATGLTMISVSNCLSRMKAAFLVDGGGRQGKAGKWRATLKSATVNTPSEYVQAADIFQVGYRVARELGRVQEFAEAQ